MDAIIGLSGSESAFEKYLRGTSGTKRVTAANDGDTLTERYVDEPQVGGNVALTIDIKLQEATEKALNDLVPSINNKKGGAAAVVIDISDGSVLAAASYPTYSAVTYNKDYEKLYQDKQKPLYNRAFLGTYAPGSTYKMCTATAGINAGVITPRTTYKCTGAMDYYGTIFHCWERSGHDREDLADAVRDSCNIYFYNVGINAGIDALTKTAQSYGLGEATGIELQRVHRCQRRPRLLGETGRYLASGQRPLRRHRPERQPVLPSSAGQLYRHLHQRRHPLQGPSAENRQEQRQQQDPLPVRARGTQQGGAGSGRLERHQKGNGRGH